MATISGGIVASQALTQAAPDGYTLILVASGHPLNQFIYPSVPYDTFKDFTAIKDGRVDFTVTNATPARANDVAFSQPVLSIELGYLVPSNSPIVKVDDIDRPGVRIGVTKGSTSERTLPARFKNATVVPAESVKIAVAMFARGEIDLYATNKPTLFEMSDQMKGAKILDGNWGAEHMAIAIPKGREDALPLLNRFVADEQSSGALDTIQHQAGLRGAVKAARE